MPVPAKRARRADAQANGAVLLEAARELFAQRGREVTYEEIAERAGVGRATLYRHFPRREDLHMAILDGLFDELEAAAAQLGEDASQFFALFDAALALQHGNVALIDLSTEAVPAAGLNRNRRRFEGLFAAPLRRAQEAGVVRNDVTPADVRIVLLMCSAMARPTRPAGERERAFQLAREMLAG